MKNFFVKFFVKGVKILIVVAIVWIIYFILNFIDPTLFNFLRVNNSNSSATSPISENQPSFGYKIYNMFFKSSATTSKETKVRKSNSWESTSTTAWEGDVEIWGNDQANSKNDLEGMTFIYPNTSKSPIVGMKIDFILVNENNFNSLSNGDTINGSVYTGFLDTYYFNADIHDKDGSFLFSIPIISSQDLNTDTFYDFQGQYNKNLNYSNYKGKAYLVIKSNNKDVSGSVLVKIEIK